jgi:hypothetical protein
MANSPALYMPGANTRPLRTFKVRVLDGWKAMARKAVKRWSQDVTRRSNALDLDAGVFTWTDPGRIARSLKRSAEASTRRKADPYRSAMSMLVFFINRAGRGLPATRRRTLERAKQELRKAFGRA